MRRILFALLAVTAAPLIAVAPVLSGTQITPLQNGFVATWTTDQPSTTVVRRASDNAVLFTDGAMVTSHRAVYQNAGQAKCISNAYSIYLQSVNGSAQTGSDTNGGANYPISTAGNISRSLSYSAGAGTYRIFDPTFAALGAAAEPPNTTWSRAARWFPFSFTEDAVLGGGMVRVSLAPDLTCSVPPNIIPEYVTCSGLIAPTEFQIGLRSPAGVYYPLLDREEAAAAAVRSSSLCFKFYHNAAATDCNNVPLGFGGTLAAALGANTRGTWNIVVTHNGTLVEETPPASGIYKGQGSADILAAQLDMTVAAPCASSARQYTISYPLYDNGYSDDCITGGVGDANGYFDPGETLPFYVAFLNNSDSTMNNVRVDVIPVSANLQVVQGTANLGNLGPGGTGYSPTTRLANPLTIKSIAGNCTDEPLPEVILRVTASGGYTQDFVQQFRLGQQSEGTFTLISLSASIPSGSSTWRVSNTTGPAYNSTYQRFDYLDRCGGDTAQWPKFDISPSLTSPKPNDSEPFLLAPVFTNGTYASGNCTTQVAPTYAGTDQAQPNPVCMYPTNLETGRLLGSSLGYAALDMRSLNWNIPYPAACNLAGADTRLTSASPTQGTPVSSAGYSSVQFQFSHAFWSFWDPYLANDPNEFVKRDNAVTVEIASDLTASSSCPLDPLNGRRWCEVHRLQNHSTDYLRTETVDVSTWAANTNNIQVRFRFQDPGWYQNTYGDLYYLVRTAVLYARTAPVINACRACGDCISPVFNGLGSVVDVGGGCSDSGVRLSWTNVESGCADQLCKDTRWGDGGKNFGNRRYDIYRTATIGGVGTVIGQVSYDALAGTTLTFDDTTGTNGTTYQYWVTAVNACGLSTFTIKRTGADLAPSAPVFPGTPTVADNNSCTASGITVGWTPPANSAEWGDGGTGTRSFRVTRDASQIVSGLSGVSTSYNDASPGAGVHTYFVTAVNGCGITTNSPVSGSVTDQFASAPTGFTGIATAADINACTATGVQLGWNIGSLNWNDNGVNSVNRYFQIVRDGGNLTTVGQSISSFNTTPPLSNTSYAYQVLAVNGCTLSAGSGSSLPATDVRDTVPPPAVGGATFGKSGSNLTMSWGAATDACGITNYRVYGASTPTPLTTLLASPAGTSYNTEPLASARSFYTVTAVDGGTNEGPR